MPWKPPGVDKSEIERLTKLIDFYETTNFAQKSELERAKANHEENIKQLAEAEAQRKKLVKTINSLEGKIKFDKIASDGIKKKFNLLEVDFSEVCYDRDKLTAERAIDKKYIKELEEDLNENRVQKLRYLHANKILERQNAHLIESEGDASDDAVAAREDLLARLQDLDNIMALNATQAATIEVQSEELIALTKEVQVLKEKQLRQNQQIIDSDLISAEYNRTIDALQQEISRLRKELVQASGNANAMSDWAASRGANRVSTAIATTTYSGDGDGAFASRRRPFTQSGVVRARNKTRDSGSHAVTGGIDYASSLSEGPAPQTAVKAGFGPAAARAETAVKSERVNNAGIRSVASAPSQYSPNKLNNAPTEPLLPTIRHAAMEQAQGLSLGELGPSQGNSTSTAYHYEDTMLRAEKQRRELELQKPPHLASDPQALRGQVLQQYDDLLVDFSYGSSQSQEQNQSHFSLSPSPSAPHSRVGTAASVLSPVASRSPPRRQAKPRLQQSAGAGVNSVLSPSATPQRSSSLQQMRLQGKLPQKAGSLSMSSTSGRLNGGSNGSMIAHSQMRPKTVAEAAAAAGATPTQLQRLGGDYERTAPKRSHVEAAVAHIQQTYGSPSSSVTGPSGPSARSAKSALKKSASSRKQQQQGVARGEYGAESEYSSRISFAVVDAPDSNQQPTLAMGSLTESESSWPHTSESAAADAASPPARVASSPPFVLLQEDSVAGLDAVRLAPSVPSGTSGDGGMPVRSEGYGGRGASCRSSEGSRDGVSRGASNRGGSGSGQSTAARRVKIPGDQKKTLYVSSGLGFRHNEQLDAELQNLNKGSAKQVIRNMLGDKYDED